MSGSGFFLSNDGFFATAHHVVKDASKIQLVLPDGSSVSARIVGYDRANDLAVLKAEGRFFFLTIGNSGVVRRGTGVMTVGYPNAAIQGREPKVTRGIVNSLTGIENDPRVFQVDLPIQTGNSGGPLVLDTGDVIGVVVSKLSDLFMLKSSGSLPQNVNYAVKSNYLRELIATIPLLNQNPLPSDHMRPTDFAELTALVERSTALVVARSQKVPISQEPSPSEKEKKEPIISRRLPDPQRTIAGVEFTEESGRVSVANLQAEARTTLLYGDRVWQCLIPEQEPINIFFFKQIVTCRFANKDPSDDNYHFIVVRNGMTVRATLSARHGK